jgi:hypothetical protein
VGDSLWQDRTCKTQFSEKRLIGVGKVRQETLSERPFAWTVHERPIPAPENPP